jgi:hypothetical protein
MKNRSPLRRWLSLTLAGACLWGFVWGLLPALIESSPALKEMDRFANFHGIETGAFYYTDVEIVGRASHEASATIRFPPKGPGPVDEN